MPAILFFDEITESDANRVGGKGFSLARMLAAGLPVPPGFVVSAEAYRTKPESLRSEVEAAYTKLGNGLVAVRSSALGEDGTETSFAGQMTTLLGIRGNDDLWKAIQTCWDSLHTDRAKAYRLQQGLSERSLSMAVVVQQLIPADVAGVMFTRDPSDSTGERMAIEASWGLGEVVVSGRVTPDRYAVHRTTSEILQRSPGEKLVRVTAAGEEPVPVEIQYKLCLNDEELKSLAELGRKVEAYYGDPRDIEWAIAGGKAYLLQARPITTETAASREKIRREVIDSVKQLKGTAWVKFNLSEVLPEPTPMTWDIIQRLLAQDGGFGAMNRDLGAVPDESLGSLSGFDLIAGRPMMNLDRMPRMQFRRPPMGYPIAEYKKDPAKALDPQPVLTPMKDGILGLARLPGTIFRLWKMMNKPRGLSETFAKEFTEKIAPKFAAEAKTALNQAWAKLDSPAVLAELNLWIEKTLVEFARESLKPTVLAKLCWDTLTQLTNDPSNPLAPRAAETRPLAERAEYRGSVAEWSLGAAAPDAANYSKGIEDLANGKLTEVEFLDRFGHRCRNEMELTQPRWSEDPTAVKKLMGKPQAHSKTPDLPKLTGEKLKWLTKLRTYLGLREAAKHYLLLGYAVIRRALVELDERYKLKGGIFFLQRSELPGLLSGQDFSRTIAERKKRRAVELTLELPSLLFADDLEAIGRPAPPPSGATTLQGIPLSAGVAEAPALVLTEPAEPPDEPFVLVCPSTDPAWVPLFARAKALVMETGGVLSHGAIVAREFGLPAVAGLPGVVRQLRTGQRLKVDGTSGTVYIVE